MRRSSLYSLIISLFMFTLLSCGGGGSAGIGGTGISITSSGTITAFGSIFVNGVEFETNNSTVNGDLSQVSELGLGMVVTVRGEINTDGVTGTADTIDVDIELEGPVANTPVIDTNNNTKTFTVLGRSIVVSDGSTVFDGAGFTFDSIAQNDVVEVSGYLDSNNSLQATRIEKKGTLNPGFTSIEVSGIVGNANLTATSFELIVDSTTLIINNPNGLTVPGGINNGLELEIEGTLNNNTEISATEIKLDEDLFNNNDADIEIEGFITNYIDDSNFMINGQQINASNTTFTPDNLTLGNNVKVEVEGTLVNGILQADEVEGRAGKIRIETTVSDISNVNSNRISLSYASGQTIEATINNFSKLEDDIGSSSFTITDIMIGDYLEIKGYINANEVIVVDLKRKTLETDDSAVLKGQVSAIGGSTGAETIDVLGVTYLTDSSTLFEIDDISKTRTEFFNILNSRLTNGDSIVKIEDDWRVDSTVDGIADKLELD